MNENVFFCTPNSQGETDVSTYYANPTSYQDNLFPSLAAHKVIYYKQIVSRTYCSVEFVILFTKIFRIQF